LLETIPLLVSCVTPMRSEVIVPEALKQP